MSNVSPQFPDRSFVGRRTELSWLREAVFGRERSFSPIIIHGLGGVGKTALLRQFAATARLEQPPYWIELDLHPHPEHAVESFVRETLRTTTHERRPSVVILDGAQRMSDDEIRTAVSQIFNYKAVRSLVISTRRRPNIERAQELQLLALERAEAIEMLRDSTTSP